MTLPYITEIQCLTTSTDVIHSFSIPELGIKVDAIPGRINSINFQISKPGVFYGQCTEICGTGHAFMPI
ncbi:cytochrome c oxidase subunit II, partial [Xanthomonas citri pv. citri]|nr:cytochrome c oxidase subunit II [Xanthomonas citri pv. citri]